MRRPYVIAYRLVFCCLLQGVLCLPVFAQATLTGQVTEAQTGTPLPGAHVFLSNTLQGTTTDSLGHYTLRNVPAGTYELVASMVGFQAQTQSVAVEKARPFTTDFALQEATYTLSAIEVTGEYPKDWKKNFERFEQLFLSTTKNAAKSQIVNPFVLDFAVNPEKHTFRASASAPLIVENYALGYRLQVVLLRFEENRLLHTLQYVVKTQFEEIAPENDRQRKQFEKNRQATYLGSSRHFFKALQAGQAEAAGFDVVGKTTFGNHMQRTVPEGALDDTDVYAISADSLLQATRTGEPMLIFEDFVGVRYLHEREPTGYRRFIRASRRYNTQLSVLDFPFPVTIDERGVLSDPTAVVTYGYWFWERMADMLPLEYEPPEEDNETSF